MVWVKQAATAVRDQQQHSDCGMHNEIHGNANSGSVAVTSLRINGARTLTLSLTADRPAARRAAASCKPEETE